jgi:hypothetical protein
VGIVLVRASPASDCWICTKVRMVATLAGVCLPFLGLCVDLVCR